MKQRQLEFLILAVYADVSREKREAVGVEFGRAKLVSGLDDGGWNLDGGEVNFGRCLGLRCLKEARALVMTGWRLPRQIAKSREDLRLRSAK